MSSHSNDCGHRGQGLHHIFETKDDDMHLSDLTPDYALGLLENHPYICLCIATIIQSMLESDDAFSSDSSTKSYTDQNLRGVRLPIGLGLLGGSAAAAVSLNFQQH
jgi:hypothetical protein